MNNKVAKKIATGYSNPQRHSNFQKYSNKISLLTSNPADIKLYVALYPHQSESRPHLNPSSMAYINIGTKAIFQYPLCTILSFREKE